ncbi:hypothetical protein F5Y12DRAFT_744908 [Xylaria sp. FL1777]|nr:hypothetical protein F5Y12DRAFT_744908 [Xylaria sp. FL1777]
MVYHVILPSPTLYYVRLSWLLLGSPKSTSGQNPGSRTVYSYDLFIIFNASLKKGYGSSSLYSDKFKLTIYAKFYSHKN